MPSTKFQKGGQLSGISNFDVLVKSQNSQIWILGFYEGSGLHPAHT